jgi:hypothetical protein
MDKFSEDEWLSKATADAIGGVRKIIAAAEPSIANVPVGRLSETELGWICMAAICGWISSRSEQAISEGGAIEQAILSTGRNPDPCDVAVVTSILPELAATAGVDWSQSLSAWSKNVMTNFLLLAWRLLDQARTARDVGSGKIVKKIEPKKDFDDLIPF